MVEIENILFDFNGTIVDDVDLCLDILNEMLVLRNHPPISIEKYLEIFTFPVIEYYKKAGFILPEDDFDELAKYFIKEYSKRNNLCKLNDGVEDILSFFYSQGKKMAIVSASWIDLLKRQLAFYHIDKYFFGISGLDNISAEGKISSAQRFIFENKLDISKTIFIGDTLHDEEVAEALNIKCILIANGHQSRKVLEQGKSIVLDDISQLKDILR